MADWQYANGQYTHSNWGTVFEHRTHLHQSQWYRRKIIGGWVIGPYATAEQAMRAMVTNDPPINQRRIRRSAVLSAARDAIRAGMAAEDIISSLINDGAERQVAHWAVREAIGEAFQLCG